MKPTNINNILKSSIREEEKIALLKEKTTPVPKWSGVKGLEVQYNPEKHPIMNKSRYPDIVTEMGVQEVTRVALKFQRLACERMTELITGIPIKRVYKPKNDKQKEIASIIESIYDRNRINTLNVERLNMLFAGCEVMTLWYAVPETHSAYGFETDLKLRCKNYSPMSNDELFPLFDDTGDLIALSVGYERKKGKQTVKYFDTYTKDQHIKWCNETGEWTVLQDEIISLNKIPGIYMWRPEPIWEHSSETVYEMEWTLSRNGNYLRENSKPLLAVFADEVISYGGEKSQDREFKKIAQFPQNSNIKYVAWTQAIETLKYHIQELRSLYFMQLQLPDWSYEKMSQQALSGESRKQMFIDAQLKVMKESGVILEGLDREINVVKSFVKTLLDNSYSADIDALQVEIIITPFAINDESEIINNLTRANGGRPIISQRESIELYGHSDDIDKTIAQIQQEQTMDVMQPEYAV